MTSPDGSFDENVGSFNEAVRDSVADASSALFSDIAGAMSSGIKFVGRNVGQPPLETCNPLIAPELNLTTEVRASSAIGSTAGAVASAKADLDNNAQNAGVRSLGATGVGDGLKAVEPKIGNHIERRNAIRRLFGR